MSPRLPFPSCGLARSALPLAALAVLVPVLLVSCGDPKRDVNFTIERYLGAVQQRHQRALATLWAPYRRAVANMSKEEEAKALEEFGRRLDRANKEFEESKQSGELTPDELGLGMFRALGIGKGAFSVPIETTFEEAGGHSVAHVRTRILTNLDGIDLDGLPTGVRVYLAGFPFGRLETVAVGYEDLKDESLLGSVEINWTLVKAGETMPSPTGWLVESISPDPASAVRWVPGKRHR